MRKLSINKVSIIVTSYNEGDYLDECIDSIRKQTYSNVELIIVDDCSSDEKTIELVRKYEKQGELVIWLEKVGVSKARNIGVNHASGEYIVFLDGDDKLHPTFIEKMMLAKSMNKNAEMIYSMTRLFGNRSRLAARSKPKYKNLLIYNYCFWVTCLLSRARFLEVGGFDEKMIYGIEDWELFVRYCYPGMEVIRVNEDLFYYRKKGYSRTKDINDSYRKTLAMRLEMILNNIESYSTNCDVFKYYSLDIERKRTIKTTLFKVITLLELYIYMFFRKGTFSKFKM